MNFEPIDPFQRLEEFRRRANKKLDELLAELQSSEQIKDPISFQPEVDLVETASEYRFYLSIPGQGIDAKGNKGDHLVRVLVDVPKKEFTEEQKTELRKQLTP